MTMTTEQPSRLRSLRDPLAVGALGVGAALVLHFRDPHESLYVLCPFQQLTGWPCPGCGGLRAINLLTNGDVVAAMQSNLIAVVLAVVLAAAWLRWLVRRAIGQQHDRMIVLSTVWSLIGTGAMLAFGIFRVTPWGSWFVT